MYWNVNIGILYNWHISWIILGVFYIYVSMYTCLCVCVEENIKCFFFSVFSVVFFETWFPHLMWNFHELIVQYNILSGPSHQWAEWSSFHSNYWQTATSASFAQIMKIEIITSFLSKLSHYLPRHSLSPQNYSYYKLCCRHYSIQITYYFAICLLCLLE